MAADILSVTFAAGEVGEWTIVRLKPIVGVSLPISRKLAVRENVEITAGAIWQLRGVVSHARYSRAAELERLSRLSPPLGRAEATAAALIPVRKSQAWWALAQDQRRQIFEERSAHIARSIKHLPAVARRLHHCRDLGEPFDFLTWFEFAPQDAAAFESLVGELRTTEEWQYVDREVDIRLTR